jgi:hypothetical protein
MRQSAAIRCTEHGRTSQPGINQESTWRLQAVGLREAPTRARTRVIHGGAFAGELMQPRREARDRCTCCPASGKSRPVNTADYT